MGSVAERIKALEDEIGLTDRRGEWDVELASIRAEVEAVAKEVRTNVCSLKTLFAEQYPGGHDGGDLVMNDEQARLGWAARLAPEDK